MWYIVLVFVCIIIEVVTLNALALDGIILLTFLLFCISGVRKGLVRSVLSFAGLMIALISSLYLSHGFSETIYDKVIRDNVTNQVRLCIKNGREFSADAVFGILPEFISNSFRYYGITSDNLTDIIHNAVSDADIAQRIEILISPIFIQTIRISSTLIMFFIFMILCSFISNKVASILKLPLTGQVDRLAGALFGGIKGYISLSILIFCLSAAGKVVDLPLMTHIYNNSESGFIFRYMYMNNFIYSLIREI